MKRWCAFGMLYNGISHHSGLECHMCSLERAGDVLGFGDGFLRTVVLFGSTKQE